MIKKLLCLFVFIAIVYSGFQIGKPYYHYRAFKSDLEDLAKVEIGTSPEALQQKIIDVAEEYSVPLKEKDIALSKRGKGYVINVSWEEEINILDIYRKTVDFSVNTSQSD
ncbi:MAG: hypothetical protein HZC12_04865 [Nitrospirae bacterium]|nr:hypothetical protein [Nitrospirota bacterium]